MADYDRLQKFYLAFYGRPADPGGLAYWASQMDSRFVAKAELEAMEPGGVFWQRKRNVKRLRDFGGIGEPIVAFEVHVIGAVPEQSAAFGFRCEIDGDLRGGWQNDGLAARGIGSLEPRLRMFLGDGRSPHSGDFGLHGTG